MRYTTNCFYKVTTVCAAGLIPNISQIYWPKSISDVCFITLSERLHMPIANASGYLIVLNILPQEAGLAGAYIMGISW